MTTETNLQDAGGQPVSHQHGKTNRFPLLLIVNIVLFIGLIVLYGLYFFGTGKVEDQHEQLVQMEDKLSESTSAIAYVSSDLLMEGYELAIKMRADFEGEQTRLENDLSRRQQTFQTEVEGFQRSINAGTISMDRAQAREQELMLMQQELVQLSDTYRERLAVREFEMNVELLDKISDFLERYNQEAGYDFILGYARGGGILFADEQFDITNEVLARLNEEYRSSQ
jgi:outer membrane protein